LRRAREREADWAPLLRRHHATRPKPSGKPTSPPVAQREGHHGYRRTDARQALARGLAGKLPASWRHVEENAAVEVWLTIHGATAVCGVRLSDRTMRHRTYKDEHRPAPLRPTLAAAMVRLAEARDDQVFLDPMCGAGTILAERLAMVRQTLAGAPLLWGGDLDLSALRSARANLRPPGQVILARWDATRLPLSSGCVDRIVTNPPFGKQLSDPESVGPLYRAALREYDRVLRPTGRAVLLVSDTAALREAARGVSWKQARQLRVRVLGQA